MYWMLTASVKLWRVPTFHRDLYKPTELLHKSVENTLLQQQHQHYQHHQQDEYRCLRNHPPCFVCRRVILKINLFIKCVLINFIFPPSAECQGRTKTCGEKKNRRDCKALGCSWKKWTKKCEATEADGKDNIQSVQHKGKPQGGR